MKTTTKNKRITVAAETKLEAAVKSWINKRAREYADDGAAGAYADLMHGGCSSGIVSHLVYTSDCAKFYRRYAADISALLLESMENAGEYDLSKIFSGPNTNWDKTDPLALTPENQNILAWFGFEEAARNLASRQGIED